MYERFIVQAFLLRISTACLLLLIIQNPVPAQPIASSAIPQVPPADSSRPAFQQPVADLARTNLLTNLMDTGIWIYHAPTRTVPNYQLANLPYLKATRRHDRNVSPAAINKKTILRFTITNSSDQPASAFFCPGFLLDSIQLYRLDPPQAAGAANA